MPQTNELLISLPQICAPREELLRIFDQHAQKQFIYVQAPAGYGKTISTLLWLKKKQYPFAWLFLDKYDNAPSLFYRTLCRSILDIVTFPADGTAGQPSPFEMLSQFVSSPSFSTAPVENTIEFLSMLPVHEDQYALVLDDLHNIDNEEILRSLPYLLKRLPAAMNVLLLSRTEIPGAINRMTENDKTGFIGCEELAFTAKEIRNHFISHGWFITMERADDIHTYTEGWIIVLNAMVINGDQKLSPENGKLTLEDYFDNNIWSRLDEPTRTFLMKTSIVNEFTLELCELLTESQNCSETLDMLIRDNVNLSCMGNVYRYHNLFLEYLRNLSVKSGIDQQRLFCSAARYYLDIRQFYKAAVCSMRSNDPQLKMQIIQTFFQSKNPALEQFLELSGVYDMKVIPKTAFDKSPILYMPNILRTFLYGETESTKELFDRLYEALPAFLETNHPIVDSIVTRLLLDFRIRLSDLIAFMDAKKIKWDKEFPGQAAVVTVQMPLLHRSVRDFYEFIDTKTKDSLYGVFSCVLPVDCECFYQGVTAGLLMEQNRLDEALATASAAHSCLTEKTDAEVYFGICVGLAEIYFIRSKQDRTQDILTQLHKWLNDNDAQYLLKNLLAYETRLELLNGNRDTAEKWLTNYFVSDNAFGEFIKIYQNFTTVRAYILLSETSRALNALEQLKNLGITMNRPLDTAEADVLIAIIEWISGKKKDARDRLHGVLTTLLPYRFIRVVANEGAAVLPILAAVLKKLDKNPEMEELYRFCKEVRVAAYEHAKRFKGITYDLALNPVKLSPKQTLILELLAKGYKNAEIVEITGLSINTIREHTRVAYIKLEVNSAIDAIVKAKQLGILK